ncbi:hypothetical protein JAAARDRAFT_44818 [Jaapia argillacea MUCL 33604]|uniref:Uncharacterized protein n=1 Tax=Jaapia argillacea MUCL 33604 TaxID=933084 RepID=A0A067Q686_9AGAM|nr:hypothetical protein JAAARDRAFT_44818 [Jaapia argillacea MUCL 33604]
MSLSVKIPTITTFNRQPRTIVTQAELDEFEGEQEFSNWYWRPVPTPKSVGSNVSTRPSTPIPTSLMQSTSSEMAPLASSSSSGGVSTAEAGPLLASLHLDRELVLDRIDELHIELSLSRRHPASDKDLPPPSLWRYHSTSLPGIFTHDHLYDSALGRAFHCFNSAEGVSEGVWVELLTSSVFFPSPSAFNRPDLSPDLMQYHPSFRTSNPPNDFKDSMIGRAIREWNSPKGIPVDSWTFVYTSTVTCCSCWKMRTFDGDEAHRDANGAPKCIGQELEEWHPISPSDKGKGKSRA